MNAVIFPGQGAQYPGMGQSLCDAFPEAKKIFSALDDTLGFKLSEKCFRSNKEELKDTAVQQLAILAVSLAAFAVFRTRKSTISYLSGLSLGEYSCLYAAGVLGLEDLAVLVRERAQAMQEAALANPSAMFAVIGCTPEALKELAAAENFYIANLNSPGQTVISLAQNQREKVSRALEIKAARIVELEVNGGFHSPFMEPAKHRLAGVLEKMTLKDAEVPIVSNFTGRAHTTGGEIKQNLLEQLISPVLWQKCVEFMAAEGVDLFWEIGPSKVLRGLLRKINPALRVVNLEKKADFEGLN